MLRAEVRLSTEIRHSGATGGPRLILTLHAEGPLEGFDVRGQIVIERLDAWRAEQIESELVKRLGGKAVLCLGPVEMANILDGNNVSEALQRVARTYGLDADAIAQKAAVDQATAARALAGKRIYPCSQVALAGMVERLLMRPTIGETIRRCRCGYGTSQAHVAEKCGVEPYIISRWERDEEPVPPALRGRLRQVIGLPAALWADEQMIHLVHEARREPFPVELRHAREEALMTIQGLAEAVGVAARTIGTWERGTGAPNAEHFQRLRAVLDLDGDDHAAA